MLAAAFANWISQLNERAFDAAVTELLCAHGFYDLHFTHGAYEFGKDFIAKHDVPVPTQYAFQSKAGDVGGGEWTKMRGQFEELADSGPAIRPSMSGSPVGRYSSSPGGSPERPQWLRATSELACERQAEGTLTFGT